jgi:hypothetical protein
MNVRKPALEQYTDGTEDKPEQHPFILRTSLPECDVARQRGAATERAPDQDIDNNEILMRIHEARYLSRSVKEGHPFGESSRYDFSFKGVIRKHSNRTLN